MSVELQTSEELNYYIGRQSDGNFQEMIKKLG